MSSRGCQGGVCGRRTGGKRYAQGKEVGIRCDIEVLRWRVATDGGEGRGGGGGG